MLRTAIPCRICEEQEARTDGWKGQNCDVEAGGWWSEGVALYALSDLSVRDLARLSRALPTRACFAPPLLSKA